MNLEQCEGCLRDAYGNCEAFKEHWENCFARETNLRKYIKEQNEIIRYNIAKGNTKGLPAPRRSLKRVRGRAIDNTKL